MSSGPAFPFPERPRRDSAGSDDETPRRIGALIPTVIAVVVLVGAFVLFANVYSDVLWFDQLGYGGVFWTQLLTRVVLFAVALVVMAAAVWFQLHMAWKHRPVYAPAERGSDPLARYQGQLQSMRRLVMIAVPLVIGIFAALTFASGWQVVQLFLHRQPFGQSDPQFGMDMSFYVATLPFLRMIVGFVSSVVLFSGLAGLIMNYLFGGITLQDRGGLKITRAAGWQTAVSVALFLLVQAANYALDAFAAVQSQSGQWAGAMYTDVHAVIPTKTILAIAAIVVAALFVVGAVRGRWKLPLVGTAMVVVVAIVAGAIYPAMIQQFQVQPSQKTREREYIQRNIDMTRQAYGLDTVEVAPYAAKTKPEKNGLAKDAATTTNIRLLDPTIVSPAFAQLQQFRDYYQFPSTLAVDRYEVDGKVQDTVIAVREVNAPTDSWVNEHVTYTHGYGVVAAYGNRIGSSGGPDFMLSGMPSTGVIAGGDKYEPRIYFGQKSPQYSLVGSKDSNGNAQELDRPNTAEASGGDQDVRYTFTGDGGPKVDNIFNRLVYALKFGSMDMMLSSNVGEGSQILYDRDPQERVRKVAPYLTVDSTAYPAIVDGRVKWIVDGYTTSNQYPYANSQRLGDAVQDTLTTRTAATEDQMRSQVNYIRNSVKATVDAYDGKVELFAWEPDEPLLKAWQGVFPSTLKPMAEMSPELMKHVRYPEDLFKVQRELLGTYHVTNADDFYEGNDAWQVPNDPTAPSGSNSKQPPYYLSLRMPKQESEAFSLTSTFIPRQQGTNPRNIMYGFLAADGDAGDKPGEKAEGYGKLRLLELPRQTSVPGPGQAQQNFDSNDVVSRELNLLRQGASTVKSGNLLTLPVADGILYVQPVYVQSSGTTQFPTLRKVLVSYGDKVGFADTLAGALDQVFEGDSGVTTGEEGGGTAGGATPEPNRTEAQQRTEALKKARDAIDRGQQALAKNDFEAYGKAQKELDAALAEAIKADDAANAAAQAQGQGATPSTGQGDASPSPSGEGK